MQDDKLHADVGADPTRNRRKSDNTDRLCFVRAGRRI